jgi:hypothetical protein
MNSIIANAASVEQEFRVAAHGNRVISRTVRIFDWHLEQKFLHGRRSQLLSPR